MPTARESLLDAALSALGDRSWATIRMVDVAATAGVSRQTLYNEFGTKEGLARALARREAEAFLAGVERALDAAGRQGADAGDCFAAATAWTLHSARRRPLVRAVLTGCRGDRVPAAAVVPVPVPRLPGRRQRGTTPRSPRPNSSTASGRAPRPCWGGASPDSTGPRPTGPARPQCASPSPTSSRPRPPTRRRAGGSPGWSGAAPARLVTGAARPWCGPAGAVNGWSRRAGAR